MKSFEYRKVSSLEEAFRLFQEYGEGAKILAGGTDLFIKMRNLVFQPEILIDLKGIPEMDRVSYHPSAGLRIGALASIHLLETSPLLREKFGVIAQAAASLGSYQIRCRATLGGNIGNASPAADMVPGLITLGARARIVSLGGERFLPLEEIFSGPGKTNIHPGEILTEVQVPALKGPTGCHYTKHSIRNAMDLAVVGVAVTLSTSSPKDRLEEVRIALGAVGPVPMRAPSAEGALRGQKMDEELISRAAFLASEEAQPVSDIRASAEYRREMVRVITQRAVRKAWRQLTEGGGN
jgi:aerobic carbon-monoxide dehydrogenase medium subunit